MSFKTKFKSVGLTVLAVSLLVACGGSGNGTAPVTSVKVFGDSLADGGTFSGISATVQSGTTTRTQMYPDLIASSFGAAPLCQHYTATGASSFAPSASAAGCSNFAIGGGRVLAPASVGIQLNVTKQLSDAAAKYGSYSVNDLLLIDGGGNDVADMVESYLSNTNGASNYPPFLARLIDATTLNTMLSQGKTAEAGVLYMQTLANLLQSSVKTNALDKGARYVAILNAPLVTNTPRFKRTLASISAAYGGGAAGAAAAAGVEQLTTAWVQAYNTQLANNFKGDSRVVIVDFYADYNAQVLNPASYGISNGTTPACEALGASFTSFAACTASALSALQPANPNWWKNYAYSDAFHPTPFGHELLAANIKRALKAAGWQ